ncbi:glycoside hydrolase [Teratosphaeria nubilosa]|uniref:chitinase n=1 Tax=Teratosphaeria nubilosa TaxID=161662 RepID=A0A6G1L9D6_9PEZI|nr:glycoside hydrolase [Teratosphaeria nubilosa]
MGKKVLLSIGGATSTGSFASDVEAEQFANTLWSLFGGNPSDNATTLPLRPFGPQIVLDGFDIDVEDKNTTGWTAFASAMRSLYSTDTSKTYYLSAAPQCPIPDASIPQDTMALCDFVWIQFYDNPSCNVGSSGFLSSFAAWSNLLRNNSNIGTPRLFFGGLALDSGSGYISGGDFVNNVTAAKALPNLGNFGGTMLWDGSAAFANIDGTAQNYLQYAKAAAQGNGTT